MFYPEVERKPPLIFLVLLNLFLPERRIWDGKKEGETLCYGRILEYQLLI